MSSIGKPKHHPPGFWRAYWITLGLFALALALLGTLAQWVFGS